jgi:Domain of unknown function (DUF4440)
MTNDIDELTALNRDFVASAQNSDVRHFDEILAPEFYCSNPDKSLVDRAAFLEQTAKPVAIKNLQAHDVKIRIMGDFAIIHAATSYTTPDGQQARALHRLLGEAEREMARGIGACGAMTRSRHCRAWPGNPSPTPNALNDGKANFSEFHSVYIEPGSYEIYKRTGEFRVVAIVSARIQAEDSAMSLQLGPFI